jgi:hypothetical protein
LVSLFQTTVVPDFMQKLEFPLAPGMLGVAEAAFDVRFTSTEQGSEGDPQVLAAVQRLAGLGSEHAYLPLLFFVCASAIEPLGSRTTQSENAVTQRTRQR